VAVSSTRRCKMKVPAVAIVDGLKLRLAVFFVNDSLNRWALVIAAVLVVPPWVWLALRTGTALNILLGRAVPLTARTIWFVKAAAIVVGAGNVFGIALDLGVHWSLALAGAAAIVLVALSERVKGVIPPAPLQTQSSYEASWEELRHIRSAAWRSLILFVLLFFSAPLVAGLVWYLIPRTIRWILLAAYVVVLISTLARTYYFQWKYVRWTCPRCGCLFRGVWRPWMPRQCAYCALPRWTEKTDLASEHPN